MRFWDSSAVVPLLVTQANSARADKIIAADDVIAAWWGTRIECHSAVARMERDGELTTAQVESALDRLRSLEAGWIEIAPAEAIRASAVRLLRTHPLRAADALQLAAAIFTAEPAPRSLPFVTFDERLALAASKEGFPVITTG